MSDKGVFAISRGIWDHPILSRDNKPFSKCEAWIWLLSEAVWKPTKINFAGRVISLERAEFCHAVRFLASKWHWTKSRVEWFIATLKKHDMLQDRKQDGAVIYKIVNYNDYQVVGLPKRDNQQDTQRDTNRTRTGHEQDKEETLKHLNTEEEVPEAKASGRLSAPLPTQLPLSSNGHVGGNDAGEKPGWWPKRDQWKRIVGDVDKSTPYALGKYLLGHNAGGQITKLRNIYGDARAVTDILMQATEQGDPRSWIAKCIRDADNGAMWRTNDEVYPVSAYRA